MKNQYSLNDTDTEHLRRLPTNKSPPPRVLNPGVLEVYGIDLTLIQWFVFYISQGLAKEWRNNHLSDLPKIDGIKGSGFKEVKKNPFAIHSPSIKDASLGQVDWFVGTSKHKNYIQYRNLPIKHRNLWDTMWHLFLQNYLDCVFPYHIHFILKDSIINPLPVPYFECFLKAETAREGNIFADIKEGDTSVK